MKKKGHILIIDDNEEILLALDMYLSAHFSQITTVKSPEQIPSLLTSQKFDVILLDMNFKAGVNTGNEGVYWLNEILKRDANAVVILITAYGEVDLAVKAIKAGATDFIQKPWDEEKLLATLFSAYKLRQTKDEANHLRASKSHLNEGVWRSHQLCIGNSEIMKQVMETVDKVAKTDANVLLLGENGVGKEVIAREIHLRSLRKDEIFVKVDLGSLSASLFESELFGYEKSAFTDAKEARAGRFEIAHKGSLFLDEIGNMTPQQQTKLLSVLQTRQFNRLGSSIQIETDIRLISATNAPIFEKISEGEFREDLLYRLNTIQIEIPPLRQRREDIPELVNFFFNKWKEKYNKAIEGISVKAMEKLVQFDWPGNIRELEHSVEKAVILSDTSILDADDFDFSRNRKISKTDVLNLEELEKQAIISALDKYNGNIAQSVKELGISRKTMYNKMKKYGI